MNTIPIERSAIAPAVSLTEDAAAFLELVLVDLAAREALLEDIERSAAWGG